MTCRVGTDMSTHAAGYEVALALITVQSLAQPLDYTPAVCSATLLLERNVTHSLMAGLPGEALMSIEVRAMK